MRFNETPQLHSRCRTCDSYLCTLEGSSKSGGLELPLLLIYIQIILSLENPVTVSGNPRNCLQALVTLAGGRKTSNGSFQMVFREVFIMASNNSHAFTLPII